MPITVVIPARYPSSRLPGKPLADILGKSMLYRVHQQAVLAGIKNIIIATDDPRIISHASNFGGKACLTSESHQSGTERVAEIAQIEKLAPEEIIITLQGDEPLMPSILIKQLADHMQSDINCQMATIVIPLNNLNDAFDPNIVKVVLDKDQNALYFSRAPIPYARDAFPNALPKNYPYYRHLGIYAYRADFLKRYVSWPASNLEKIESLEQLRVLWHGEKIYAVIGNADAGPSVDTPDDLERVKAWIQANGEIA